MSAAGFSGDAAPYRSGYWRNRRLDLGAGTADLSIEFIRQSGPDTHMIGMDITPEMLAKKISSARITNTY